MELNADVMTQLQYLALAAGVAVLSITIFSGWIWCLFWFAAYLTIIFLGFFYAVHWNLVYGINFTYKPSPDSSKTLVVNKIIKKMMELDKNKTDQTRKVVISRNLDNIVQDVINLICQNYILSWYEPITKDRTFIKQVQNKEILNEKTDEEFKKFMFHSWLKDDQKELKCLRDISDTVLLLLLSKPYATCDPLRHLLREIITTSVLKPAIDLLCDPHFINQKLLDYMAYREKLYADTKRTYMYSATYEGFIKMIKSSESINDLKQMRYNIISEILQASAINRLKKQHGLNTDKDVAPKGTNKGELLKARNLERYKNQDQRHHVASEIYQQYIASSSSLVKVDKIVLKGMEEFLRGDKGHDAFVVAQKLVQNFLEEHYYPSFIVSDTYHLLSASIRDSMTSDEESVTSDELFLESDNYSVIEETVMSGQSYHAQQRLRALDSKIINKMKALRCTEDISKTGKWS
ncbi:hypothetical protein Btru_031869 [Bulinus truncatus]|nr:hypothetical protein Btru_031869 [Bulinus truncatus]